MYGTQNETIARSMVAARVTTKPGVAGRRQLIGSYVVVGKEPVAVSSLVMINLRHRLYAVVNSHTAMPSHADPTASICATVTSK